MTGVSHDMERFRVSLVETKQFLWKYSPQLVAISILWTLCSIPVVTAGPATVMAHSALRSLRESGTIEVERVVDVTRQQFLPSVLLSVVIGALGVTTALYARFYILHRRTIALLFAIMGVYGVLYLLLLLIPTFVSLGDGQRATTSLKRGYRWSSSHATLAMTTLGVTLVLMVVLLVLMVGFVLLFPAIAFSLHLHLVSNAS